MLLHRREDFLSPGWSPAMKKEAERLGSQINDGLAQITRRLFGRNTLSARHVATFAVLDVPFSAVRRFVATNQAPPRLVDELIASAYTAVIEAGIS